MVLYDSHDRAWQVEDIAPLSQPTIVAKVLAPFHSANVRVRLAVRPITEAPLSVVRKALIAAIDADDDILTQFTAAGDLKDAVQKAQSFEALLGVLQEKRAI
jgi:hypothetical protein